MANQYNIPEFLSPDLIINNGKIITVDEKFSFAEAVAVKDGKIAAVGSKDEIEALRGAKTKTLDLKGNVLLPGINDSHMHLTWTMVSRPPYMLDLSYPGVKNIKDIRERLKAAVAKTKPGEWILGGGWNPGIIEELVADLNRVLNKTDLDDISPNNPVWFYEFSRHTSFVNSKALEAAGLNKNTPDPVGGMYHRGPDGDLDGYMLETANAAIELAAPKYSVEQMVKAFNDNISYMSEYGVTSCTTASERPQDVKLYSRLYRDAFKKGAHFPIRINMMMLWSNYALGGAYKEIKTALEQVGTATNFGNEWIKIGGIKLFGDGIPPTKTAWMYNPYSDGSHASLVVPGNTDEEKLEELERIVNICHDNGYQLAVHATGDHTVDETVKKMAKAMERDPWDARHYIIHADFTSEESMKLMGKYNIAIATQAELKYVVTDDIIARLGEEVAAEEFPLKQFLDHGITVCNSSDTPCATPDWRPGMQTAVVRESMSGVVSGPHQCLSIEDAIRSYTINGAWLEHMEDLKGSVEAGKLADFCIIGKDITAIDPHEIHDTPIHMTIVGGHVVFSDGKLEIK
jgi:predicted amidohydrolase YtcJ